MLTTVLFNALDTYNYRDQRTSWSIKSPEAKTRPIAIASTDVQPISPNTIEAAYPKGFKEFIKKKINDEFGERLQSPEE